MCERTMSEWDETEILESEYCEKQQLAWKLQSLCDKEFRTDERGVNFVRVQFIENLIKELKCSI